MNQNSLNQSILWLHELRLADLARVGGKNSSLGEMIGQLSGLGVSVPGGYATTSEAVSYTHLDVYKRQVLPSSKKLNRVLPCCHELLIYSQFANYSRRHWYDVSRRLCPSSGELLTQTKQNRPES